MTDDRTAPPLSQPALLGALRRYGWLLVLCAVVGALAAGYHTGKKAKTYESSATMLFQASPASTKLFGASSGGDDPARVSANNLSLVTAPEVIDQTASKLGISASEVSGAIDASANGDSDVVTVTAKTNDPQSAARIANEYARQFVAYSRSRTRTAILEARDRLLTRAGESDDSREEATLREQAAQLLSLASVDDGDVSILATGDPPSSPSGPHTKRAAVIGGALGLAVGFALLALLARLDDRVRDPRRLLDLEGFPLLAVVPRSRALPSFTRGSKRLSAERVYSLLAASLLDADGAAPAVVGVTASEEPPCRPVARELARAFAALQPWQRVLVIETSRDPAAGIETLSSPGLTEVLAGRATAEAAIRPLEGTEDVQLLPASSAVGMTPTWLHPKPFSDLLAALQPEYPLIIVAGPSTDEPRALSILRNAAAIAAVVPVGKTTWSGAGELIDHLRNSGLPLRAVVARDASGQGFVRAVGGDRSEVREGVRPAAPTAS